jgi:hypothetical protein
VRLGESLRIKKDALLVTIPVSPRPSAIVLLPVEIVTAESTLWLDARADECGYEKLFASH